MIDKQPEVLGSYYLGAKYDLDKKEITQQAVHYDSRDLKTHAICVGMTGSGKTGLCVGLLEEAAMDKIPAIIIDPKGDMTNLLLQFENLDPAEFRKWVSADDAERKGMDIDSYALATAKKWKEGLATWGQGPDRIQQLKNTTEYTIYTPGSDAGVPINILGSFAAPDINFDEDAEMLRERIQGIVGALLGMINSKEDPVRSREGILLAQLFEHHWRAHEDLSLTKLITGIANPPFSKMGVFDLETFYPQKDRFDLSMEFNMLIASPSFQNWLQGDPLDIDQIYFTAAGKPRHSIFYIAHLTEQERMFFVTLLLNSLITWMRKQTGTSSLRSILYFDEIFGYFPPTGMPPSKKPLLTILKQARAYGLGAVLVTQNPVDIDYKGLSNAGTWFVGKMQTERDVERMATGLESAMAEAGISKNQNLQELISSLDSRVFLLHNVHEDAPIIYHTRWVMSYLAGPMTRPQIKELMSTKKNQAIKASPTVFASPINQPKQETKSKAGQVPPTLDPSIIQKFFPVWKTVSEAKTYQDLGNNQALEYIPQVLGSAKVRYVNITRKIDHVEELALLASAPDEFGRTNWDQGRPLKNWDDALLDAPDHAESSKASYADVPESMNTTKKMKAVKDEFEDYLYQNKRVKILEHSGFKIYQASNENESAFQNRVLNKSREDIEDKLDDLQDRYEKKFYKQEERIRKEEQDLEDAEEDLRSRKQAEMIGMAETIFSMFGGRRSSRRMSSTASKNRMKRKAKQKVEESEDDLRQLQYEYEDIRKDFNDKKLDIMDQAEEELKEIQTTEIKPRRTDIAVQSLILVWHPFWVGDNGNRVSALK